MPTLESLLSLPRPEYAKQTELVLVDLLWRSEGTVLGQHDAIGGLAAAPEADRAMKRLVLEKISPKSNRLVSATAPWLKDAARQGIFSKVEDADRFSDAMINSIAAPRSQRDQSKTCAPVHRGSIPLQTLNGAVNKNAPPNLAKAVEVMAQLGGATYAGAAGARLAAALDEPGSDFASLFFEHVAPIVWSREGNTNLSDWPSVISSPSSCGVIASDLTGLCRAGPQGWFWERWEQLLDPTTGWRGALPDRRFIDWATCLVRTGLALTYLWEAAVFRALRDVYFDKDETAWNQFTTLFRNPGLIAISARGTPPAEKDMSALLGAGLGDGYHARAAFDIATRGDDAIAGRTAFLDLDGGHDAAMTVLSTITVEEAEAYRDPRLAPKTLKEFVRYLMLARVASDAAADEADLYYLARTDRTRKRVWAEPGPEWMVVIASLATKGPGRQCTLQDVMSDLRRMGVVIERATLVDLLEGAGLTQDSPDADEAIVISSGF